MIPAPHRTAPARVVALAAAAVLPALLAVAGRADVRKARKAERRR